MTSLLNIAGNIPAVEAGGQSLRFEDGDSAYLSWTPASAGNRKTWTYSTWVKRANLGGTQLFGIGSGDSWMIRFSTSNKIACNFAKDTATNYFADSTRVFRDTSAWYHIVVACDTTQSTASDRVKIYVNGELETITGGATTIPQNRDTDINVAAQHRIGAEIGNRYYSDGYLANVTFIDGTALDPTSFGEYDDTLWRPKSDADITGNLTFGTNGFYLPFKQTTEAEGFSTVTYTGTSSQQAIEGVGFEPDFVWIKNRSSAYHHGLFDSVRGANKVLKSSDTSAEVTYTEQLKSFDANGFSLGDNSDSGNYVNISGNNYVAWCWDAGSGSPVSNTDGSITSTVKANTAKGFSIVSYTGNGITSGESIGHGLSQRPDMVIIKGRDAATSWDVIFPDYMTATQYMALNSTNGITNSANSGWGGSLPDSTKVYVGGSSWTNTSGNNYIAYCFHSVSGYSSIGSYTGDGTSNGSKSINLGFKPAFVMIKRTNATENWMMLDTTRNPSGIINNNLYANLSNAESDYDRIEATATGFDIYSNFNDINASGSTYIYMAFADTRDATFFGDTSGNGNNWTPNALNNTDVVPDSPVTGGNFAVSNVLDNDRTNLTASEGNLKIVKATASTSPRSASTIGVKSGKWYWETRWSSFGGSGNYYLITGVTTKEQWTTTSNSYNTVGYAGSNDATVNGKSFTTTNGSFGGYVTYGSGYTTSGDIIGTALDLDGGTVTFYLNGTSQGSISLPSTDEEWFGYTTTDGTSNYATMHLNFGQDSSFAGTKTPQGNTDDNGVGDFYYAPPSGYLALATSNLPTPTITAPDEYFNTVLYTGNSSTQSITGVNFQPSWLWIKNRSTSNSHALFDSVRGSGTNGLYGLQSNTTNAEIDGTNVASLDSDGFTLGSNGGTNGSGNALVAWNWLAGGTAVSNTSGSITSTVSANQTAGFSVVGWTGTGANATVGHGLSSAPEMIIVKNRTSALGWPVYHSANGATKFMQLEITNAVQTASTVWQDTAPTSNVFSVGTSTYVNQSSSNFIAYCFHSVESYSKCGSYTGNGSADGTFVHCGFRPAFVMVKRTDGANNWLIQHNKSLGYNPSNSELYANLTNAEATADRADFLSNGFKARINSTENNGSGASYIFIAFAEAPFKSANAR